MTYSVPSGANASATGAHCTPPVWNVGSCSLGRFGSNSPRYLPDEVEPEDGAHATVGDVELVVLGVLGDVERDDRLGSAEGSLELARLVEDQDLASGRVAGVDVVAIDDHADRTLQLQRSCPENA